MVNLISIQHHIRFEARPRTIDTTRSVNRAPETAHPSCEPIYTEPNVFDDMDSEILLFETFRTTRLLTGLTGKPRWLEIQLSWDLESLFWFSSVLFG